ncbi:MULTISPECIES: tetratricopeptide repeat protein [Rhodopirellula]|uniref:tetratricopeptide repeat protein n=1 Tax=Rhodopirellula TaxID=265488 RepID=UPI001F1D11CA|nr:tetratricopeptide repeat protein [Rhodopirellula europaea]
MTTIHLLSRSSLAIIASLVVSIAGFGSVQAQHGHHGGGHGFGHGGHSIGHGGHGFGHAGHGIGHGIGHSIGHGIGHSIGHGIGHGSVHHGGHVNHYSGHHGIGHEHYGIGHSFHPHIDVYASPYYSGFGYSSVGSTHLHTPYYDYYTQTPSSVVPSVIAPPSAVTSTPSTTNYSAAKPAISLDSNDAVTRVGSAESRDNAYRGQAEEAFRNSNYGEAVRLANHALVESPNDGKLMLLYAQGLFAVGDYQGAAGAIHRAASLLNPEDWGYVVKNYGKYYQGNGFVDQMKRLESFLKSNPEAGYARFLRGYQFGYLGQTDVAIRDLNRALELESRDQLAAELVSRFGGTPITIAPEPAGSRNEPIQMDGPPPSLSSGV